MPGNGYSSVPERGFIAFEHDLEAGAWKAVSTSDYDSDSMIAKAPIADAPTVVSWKLQARWAIRALVKATGADNLAKFDAEWDAAQRAITNVNAAAEDHKDPAVREAASRLRANLLAGGGLKQTQDEWDMEVDYGRNQVLLAEDPVIAADIAKVGLGDHLARVHEATEALAKAIGREPGKNRSPARGRRVRDARRACSAAFNAIHDDLAWAIEHTDDFAQKERLQALLAPFEALLARYPAAAPAAEEPAGDAKDEKAPR